MLQAKERTPTPSDVFTFGLIVESIKEFGNALEVIYIEFFTLRLPLASQDNNRSYGKEKNMKNKICEAL
jgi:hypothetical protein